MLLRFPEAKPGILGWGLCGEVERRGMPLPGAQLPVSPLVLTPCAPSMCAFKNSTVTLGVCDLGQTDPSLWILVPVCRMG